jgi:hypothetical protein
MKCFKLDPMKKQILAGLLGVVVSSVAFGQPANSYVNNTVANYNCSPSAPPNIDALNFINNSIFIVDLFFCGTVSGYATADTINYTNFGVLASATGLRLDTYNRQLARYTNAGSLYNDVGASIFCGGTNFGLSLLSSNFLFSPQLTVSATNIINKGLLEMGPNDFLSLSGQNVDLRGGLLNMEGFESGNFVDAGIFDVYWGFGHNENFVPSSSLTSSTASTFNYWITNRYYNYFQTTIGEVAVGRLGSSGTFGLTFATPYQNTISLGPSNVLFQTVYVQNQLDPAITNNVYFDGAGGAAVEWTWAWTNVTTGQPVQDFLYLYDQMFFVTNFLLHVDGTAPASTGHGSTFIPTNFLSQAFGLFDYLDAAHPPGGFTHTQTPQFTGFPKAPPGIIFAFSPGKATNDYFAYQALFRPTTVIDSPFFEVAGQTYSNMPGRMELNASSTLNLSSSRIAGLNYIKFNSTNHTITDSRTRNLTYAGDFNLSVTNGTLTVTNLMAPTCPRPNGNIVVFSARWTNVTPAFITNVYTLTLVDSEIQHQTPTIIPNLSLHSDNVIITDVLNVTSNLLIDAFNLTIATNAPGSLNPAGQLNLLSGNIIWTNSFPRLQTLTNYGVLTVNNTAFFGGVHYPPFYPTGDVTPYYDFVNRGTIVTIGAFIWATNFENSGLIDATAGSLTVQATTATLTNGQLMAGIPNSPFNSDITLYASSLFISNTVLTDTRKLSILATNSLSDGDITSTNFHGNFWTAGAGGFNLLAQPAVTANLLGTTISNTSPDFGFVTCQWAGQDRGPDPVGYSNNAALGRLVFDAGFNSSFTLQGVSTSNALYVDYLEFRDYATNYANQNVNALQINPGIKIYYAQAFLVTNNATGEGFSVAEKFNHYNGGALNWVPGYAGAFSSTTWTNTDGKVYKVNSALRFSTTIDSDNDATVNAQDQTPFFVPTDLQFSAVRTNLPPLAALLSWQTMGSATNYVFYKARLSDPAWLSLTQFVSGPFNGRVSALDNLTTSNRFYKVRVDGNHAIMFGP